ncbi:transmembrane protein [Colletotrichum kahawae]|uniref:Transmembrane protein n=1 Tax=Colletotrichum kahawae TaxID=34407 RepID=A0AAE0DB96_COLKA|nr:transmembrane protein [Colletotrichum kahawae]
MSETNFQPIITSPEEKPAASKRRAIYLRPFLLFYINSFIFEVIMVIVSIIFFSGWRDMLPKFMWTIVFCPLGMGGAMGGLINAFIVDRIYGSRAVHLAAIMSVLVLGACKIYAIIWILFLDGSERRTTFGGGIGDIWAFGSWGIQMES